VAHSSGVDFPLIFLELLRGWTSIKGQLKAFLFPKNFGEVVKAPYKYID
jgi:hypothetical protein